MAKGYGPLSLNEILFFFTRATVGAGAPFGVGEDVAKAAVFLAECGFDPGPIISSALQNLDKDVSKSTFSFHTSDREAEIGSQDEGQVSAIFAGPAALDWLESKEPGQDIRLKIQHLDSPFLIAAMCTEWMVTVIDQAGVEKPLSTTNPPLDQHRPFDVMITNGKSGFSHERNGVLEYGVLIDQDAWVNIHAFFHRCLVPSTAESRIAGAGAGLVDTD